MCGEIRERLESIGRQRRYINKIERRAFRNREPLPRLFYGDNRRNCFFIREIDVMFNIHQRIQARLDEEENEVEDMIAQFTTTV